MARIPITEQDGVPFRDRWHTAVQGLAETTSHAVPITLSSDPRHGVLENSGASWAAGSVSPWPGALGPAAVVDVETLWRAGSGLAIDGSSR